MDHIFNLFREFMYRSYHTLLLCKCHCLFCGLRDAGSLQCGDLNNLASELLAELVDMYLLTGLL